MRILLSDMAPQLRAQVRLALQRQPWVTSVAAETPSPAYDDPGVGYEPYGAVVGPAASADGLTGRVGALGADLVVLDWDLAAPLPAGTLESLKSSFPQVMVAAVSTRQEERAAALSGGADLFVLTDGTPEDIVASLRTSLETLRR
jgi:DNA-binding NarL/FixJ family response regulator